MLACFTNHNLSKKRNNTKVLPQQAAHNPHNPTYWENNHVAATTSSQKLQICGFLFEPTSTLIHQFSFHAGELVGLLLILFRMGLFGGADG